MEVIVDHLEGQGEYYQAKVKLQQGNQTLVIDVRPSDAFGLALACDAPILISDDVLAKAAALGWTQPRGG
jgi:bifunctional DNase/RNase